LLTKQRLMRKSEGHKSAKTTMRNGNGRPNSFVVINGWGDQPVRSTVPPHMAKTNWVKHEARSAKSAFKDVKTECRKLDKKISEKHVHDTRVALRRWFSVWRVMRSDGWQTKKCKKQLISPLKQLQSLLGELRDVDVNMELGRKLGCTEDLINTWTGRRRQLKAEIEEFVETHDISRILKRLSRYLKKRGRQVESKLPSAKSSQSAFDHLELYLLHQESVVREEAESAQTPEELHQLRLSIKRWRYLLTEFFGVTHLELVKAQQLLGQLHDLDRLTPVLVHAENQYQALTQLKLRRDQLLKDIEEMRTRLPYGLRPEVASAKPAPPAAFEEPRT
jgi:CHAD domain-containing protein